MKDVKVALVHDYLHVFGGAEGVLEAIWEIFPNADIYSATYDPKAMEKAGAFRGANIIYPKWKDNIPGKFKKFVHRALIANLPLYFSNLDLSKYDLIISSTAHFAKGVRTTDKQLHISYIHTPPRFLYGFHGEIRKRSYWYWKVILWPLDSLLRYIDQRFANRPDYLLCNSQTVKDRIKKFYGRDAFIINPFPNIKAKDFPQSVLHVDDGFYLMISRLSAYKNIDLAIKVCGSQSIPLKVAGTGSDESILKELALKYPSVEMLGFITEDQKTDLYKRCRAVICAVRDEDFGMAPLEPMLFGKPVIALKQGGYLETVVDGVCGVFFEEITEESLGNGIRRFESMRFDSNAIRQHALKFSKDRFKSEFETFVSQKLANHLYLGNK